MADKNSAQHYGTVWATECSPNALNQPGGDREGYPAAAGAEKGGPAHTAGTETGPGAKGRPPAPSVQEIVFGICLILGIPSHTLGSLFLRESILEVIKNRDTIYSMTKTLYPKIAKQFGTSPTRVERAIRHAIETSWARGKIENINAVFGYPIYNKTDKPTNGELIALIAEGLMLKRLVNQVEEESV
jgi:two-component system response regulator (stage 0 sporulation protein A)